MRRWPNWRRSTTSMFTAHCLPRRWGPSHSSHTMGVMDVGLSDADLAPRIAAGDGEAEAELCRRMGPRIRLYALRHLRSPSAADDLVQHVLLKVLEALRAGRLRESEKLAHFVL